MAALHEALKFLAPTDYASIPFDDLETYLSDSFHHAQLLIDSVPPPPSTPETVTPSSRRERSAITASIASNASEISISTARSDPPPAEVEALQKEWGKPYKLKDNPLGMNVYKTSGKDGRGAWFARRSVHEGLRFVKWKKGLQREFPETLKVQGRPGEGNIRGIGGERRVEQQEIANVGKFEVYHLSAQFPGPTTPRDFVEIILTSDSALSEWSKEYSNSGAATSEIPRHFMVISKPCIHPDCPPREGFIRGQYESVEFIREIPLVKPPKRSASTTYLPLGHGRARSDSSGLSKEAILRNATKIPKAADSQLDLDGALSSSARRRGKTISFAESRGSEAKGESLDVPRNEEDESQYNPVEWIMITRSDPGGGIPRFMVERGTPSSIVADACKFLDWACRSDLGDEGDAAKDEAPGNTSTEKEVSRPHSLPRHSTDLHDYQTNEHLTGIDDGEDGSEEPASTKSGPVTGQLSLYGAAAGALGAAGDMVAARAPTMIANYIPGHGVSNSAANTSNNRGEPPRRPSLATVISSATIDSFASALEGTSDDTSDVVSTTTGDHSIKSDGVTAASAAAQEKAYHKLEYQRQKLDEKLAKTREKELSKTQDSATQLEKEVKNKKVDEQSAAAQAIAKAIARHQKELSKHEEKYRKELAKIEVKRLKEEQKAEEKRRKSEERDEKVRLGRELEVMRAKVELLELEKGMLQEQVGELQRANTVLTSRVGRLGPVGEELLKGMKEVKAGSGLGSRVASGVRSGAGSVQSLEGEKVEEKRG